MQRSDMIELILEHTDNQGLTDASFLEFLEGCTDDELDQTLNRLEQIAIFGG